MHHSKGAATGYSVVALSLDDRRVESFVSNHPNALVFHHPSYLHALEEESGRRCLMLACQNEDGALEGILPLFYTRGLSFNIGHHNTRRRLCCLPRTPATGVLSSNPLAAMSLVDDALHRVRAEPGLCLQIKSPVALPELACHEIARTDWRPTYVLELPESVDHLPVGNARARHNLKWAVNKAIKLGVVIREAENQTDLRLWYKLYLHTMRRNAIPPRSYRFFGSLWRHLRPRGLMRLLIAEMKIRNADVMLAGSIFLLAGKTVFYAFTGSSTKQPGTHANDLILWHAIEDASKLGYRYFDFGEVAEDHPELARFKTKWGAEPCPSYRYYYPGLESLDSSYLPWAVEKVAKRLWRFVPLPATRVLGRWIYTYL